ncbi:MAG TPA: proline--tRNA ligase [Candidatus Paceibacterota bacterium]|nr:proline--tRNA ligase [Verrucomicrobiota bacterium]HRY50428.1 proline--tRNA ligase [Candidatus Paceibacterota bacterium]
MRWTQSLIPTLRETPSEAEIISHQLLLRAGLIRKLGGGLYTFLPLGLRILRKIEAIIRQEMDRAGALEVLMPALQPADLWRQSGRLETAADVLFRVRDHAQKEWVLGPTHEEVITSLVAGEISSYRQLPRTFYQIQTKFRDEIRPRFGLMRAREFIMKDAYSFDLTDAAAQASYQRMFDAYERIFRRCGLQTMPVEADTGVMGGKLSHEFMVPAETGENQVAFCPAGDYAANLEKAAGAKPRRSSSEESPADLERFPTPGVTTIEGLSREPHGVPAERQIKTLVYLADSRPVLLLLRGDDYLNENKLAGVLGTPVFRAATADEIFDLLGAHPGSLGAIGVTRCPVIADEKLQGAVGMTTGANADGYHVRHVSVARDLPQVRWADLRTLRAGEPCPVCGHPLEIRRAIEVGHVFKLGTKYSQALGAWVLAEDGRQQPAVMGCYGIGVTRTLQAVVEQSHDKDGILWPAAIAPYQVCLTPLSVTPGQPVFDHALNLYAALGRQGVDVILDDRNERPGVKFKDADLVGFPLRVSLGDKSLARGEIELKPRNGSLQSVRLEQAEERILEICRMMNPSQPGIP